MNKRKALHRQKIAVVLLFFLKFFLGGKSSPQPPTLRTQKVNHNYLKLCSSQVDKVGKSDSKSLFSHWRFRKWLIWMFKHQIFANAHPGTVYCKAYLQISNWKSQVKLYESLPHTLNESKRSFQKLLSGFFLLRGGGGGYPTHSAKLFWAEWFFVNGWGVKFKIKCPSVFSLVYMI